jgi:hypothetical protein
MLDVSVNRFLSNGLKSDGPRACIRRELHAAKRICVPNLVQLDGIAATATFSRRSRPSM